VMGTPEGRGSVLICSSSSTLRLFRHRALDLSLRQLILPSRRAKT
jgi:hypothetical protein